MAETRMIDRFRAAPPQRQLLLVTGVALAAAAVILLAWYALRTPYQPLFTRMRPADAATVIAELDRRKAPYRLADGGATILVPADVVDATRLSVMSEDLPIKGTVGFELFNKSDMGLTDFAQKINYQRALQGELARTIMTLDGVDTARVHLSLGEDRIFREDRVPPKASVTIRMKDRAILPRTTAQGVQRLVAAAVPQLDLANVVILDEHGRTIGAAPVAAALALPDSPLLQEKRAVELYYEARARQAIAVGAPRQPVTVSAWAGLADGGAGDPAQAPGWSPADRTFPLQLTLSVSGSLRPEERAELHRLAAAAIGFDESRGDSIRFGAPTQAAPAEPSADDSAANMSATMPLPDAETAPALAPADTPVRWGQLAWGGALALLISIVLLFVRSSRPRASALTSAERTGFADRLRAALDEDRHAPPRP